MTEFLKKITETRQKKIELLGFNFGITLPTDRKNPICPPKFNNPLLIAEIKRSSPSNGKLDDIPDPISLASSYLDRGASAISVLTESDFFQGSLEDLIRVKDRFKKTTILRKDFIQFPEEIQVSYLAGSDMVLIIVAMFLNNKNRFESILKEFEKYKLTPLFEVHNLEEYEFLKPYNPKIIGINARSLHTFKINKQEALILGRKIASDLPETRIIFESGIQGNYDGYVIGASHFDGMLCGSYFIKSKKNTITSLVKSFQKAKRDKTCFYKTIFSKLAQKKSLIKICGITNIDDALACAQMGADMIGCVLTKKSPRFIDTNTLKQISKALKTLYPDVMIIGVVFEEEFKTSKELVRQNILDALQLHASNNLPYFGSENLNNADFSFYPCINYENLQDYPQEEYLPFVLLDSKTQLQGGSGVSIKLEKIKELKTLHSRIFVAGGISEDNVLDFLKIGVTMLDINSKVEKDIGKKDLEKLQKIFHLIAQYNKQGDR